MRLQFSSRPLQAATYFLQQLSSDPTIFSFAHCTRGSLTHESRVFQSLTTALLVCQVRNRR